jgi:hypothetical protein
MEKKSEQVILFRFDSEYLIRYLDELHVFVKN